MHHKILLTFQNQWTALTIIFCGLLSLTAHAGVVLTHVGLADTTTSLSSSADPAIINATIILTATVLGDLPTGSVTFKDDGISINANCIGVNDLTLAAGHATCTIQNLSIGSHPLTAVYNGNTTHSTSTSPTLNQHIAAITTTTQLNSSSGTSIYNDTITLAATVAGSSLTGSVTFADSGTSINTSCLGTNDLTIDESGHATCVIHTLSAGSHALTAVYSGDATHSASSSSIFVQNVNKASTTTILSSSTNPSPRGYTLIFTAAISGAAATGNVTFFDGDASINSTCTNINDLVLNAGYATCTLNNLDIGTHTLTANYSGNTNYTASTSPTFNQTILSETSQVTVTSGDGQSTPVDQAFTSPLEVLVTNPSGQPIEEANVIFTVISGDTGAAALLSPVGATGPGAIRLIINTNLDGKAQVMPTANELAGSYEVKVDICSSLANIDVIDLIMCSIFDFAPVSFHLTNSAPL